MDLRGDPLSMGSGLAFCLCRLQSVLASWERAVDLYFRGMHAEAIVEAFHQGSMRCYRAQARHTEFIAACRRMKQVRSAVSVVAPSPESRRLCEVSAQACGYAG